MAASFRQHEAAHMRNISEYGVVHGSSQLLGMLCVCMSFFIYMKILAIQTSHCSGVGYRGISPPMLSVTLPIVDRSARAVTGRSRFVRDTKQVWTIRRDTVYHGTA